MAERYDERFDELTGLVRKVVGRVDEIQLEMRDMRKESGDMREEMHAHATSNASRFDRLESALQIVSGRQDDVIPKVIAIQKDANRISKTQSEQTFKIIEMLNRLNVVEIQLRSLNDETKGLKLEIRETRESVHSLIDPIQIGWDLRENIKAIEERVTSIEQKLDN